MVEDIERRKVMNTQELQQLKMAWVAAKEAGDTQGQVALLRNNPAARGALIDFIAAYHATDGVGPDAQHTALLPLTQRASQRALERVFGSQEQTQVAPMAANLRALRMHRGLTLVNAAKGLRLGVDVWKKFEDGAVALVSLSGKQLERLATFFQISAEQFGMVLSKSQPSFVLDRRQTGSAAYQQQKQQGPREQSFAEALEKSNMAAEDKRFWLEDL